MPLVQQTFSQLIDFTRTSAATFVNSSGNIASTPQSRNLLTFTQEFDNAAWIKTTATVTANSTAAPDGTNTADTITPTSADSNVRQEATPSAVSSHTFSIWLRSATGSDISTSLRVWRVSPFQAVTSTTITVTPVWQRFTLTFTPLDTTAHAVVIGASSTLSTGEILFAWGAQLEQASAATDYTRNFGGLFPPRFDYDPVTRAPRGLLIEEQRTNLFTRSEEFDNAAWTKTNATVTANTTTSPDGTVDADSLIENTASGAHDTYGNVTLTATAHTFSVYVKPNGRTWINMFVFQSGGPDTVTWFNLSNGTLGTVGAGATAAITNAGNGWYRCSITFTALAAAASAYVRMATGNNVATYTGDGTSGIFLYGAQLEAGAFATSYIPTVASQVTRSADVAAINAPNFASWFNASQGTLVVSSSLAAGGANAAAFFGPSTNLIRIGGGLGQVFVNGSLDANLGSAASGITNQALAYATNDMAMSVNGAAVTTDTSCAVPSGINALQLQSGVNTYANGHIRSIRFYPVRLTNAQLQALTA